MNITEGSIVFIAVALVSWAFKQVYQSIKDLRADMKELDKTQGVNVDKVDDKSVIGDDKLNVKIEQVEHRLDGKIKDVREEQVQSFKMYRGNDHKIFDLIKKTEVDIARLKERMKHIKA